MHTMLSYLLIDNDTHFGLKLKSVQIIKLLKISQAI